MKTPLSNAFLVAALLLVCSVSCHKSSVSPTETLVAPNGPFGFSGVILFKNWPSPDSVQELRLLASRELPSDSVSFFNAYFVGQGAFYPPVGQPNLLHLMMYQADSIQYSFTSDDTNLQATTYKYIAVAWRYSPNLFTDWKPCGVYSVGPQPFAPTPVQMVSNQVISNVNINVDFKNTPPRLWQ